MMTVFVREEDSKRRIVLRNGVSLRYQKNGKDTRLHEIKAVAPSVQRFLSE